MNSEDVINLAEVRLRRAVKALDTDVEPLPEATEIENAALRFFQAITHALEDGTRPEDVDRLVNRMDRVLDAIR